MFRTLIFKLQEARNQISLDVSPEMTKSQVKEELSKKLNVSAENITNLFVPIVTPSIEILSWKNDQTVNQFYTAALRGGKKENDVVIMLALSPKVKNQAVEFLDKNLPKTADKYKPTLYSATSNITAPRTDTVDAATLARNLADLLKKINPDNQQDVAQALNSFPGAVQDLGILSSAVDAQNSKTPQQQF
jgi:hypothetical protein